METMSDSAAFVSMSHPLSFAPRTPTRGAHDGTPLNSDLTTDLQEESRSFEMGDGAAGGSESEQTRHDTITIQTSLPRTAPTVRAGRPSPARSTKTPPQQKQAQRQHGATVHVDPHRSHAVAAAAAAKKKAEEEAEAEPLTAENETWGHWSFRHAFNGFVMMLLGFYQVVQVGARRQPVDMKTITYTNSIYMPAPPREEELKRQQQQEEE